MAEITNFQQIRTIDEYINFKYERGSYGGKTTEAYENQRHDDHYDDLVKMLFQDSNTRKAYYLYVSDIEVAVIKEGETHETFFANISVTNLNIHRKQDEGKIAKHVSIGCRCLSPSRGITPTQYGLAQCMTYNADLSIFDGLV